MISFKTTLQHCYSASTKNKLFILLHGYGSNMNDLFAFADHLQPFGHVVSFDAPQHTPWGGKAWFDLNFTANSVHVSDYNQIVSAQVSLVQNITSVLSDLQLTWKDLVLMGFSQGAMMVSELLMEVDQEPAAAVLMSGRKSRDRYDKSRHAKILQTHGTTDPVIHIDQARDLSNALKSICTNFSYKEYEAMAHGISPECWNDIMNFIKEAVG